MSDGIIVILNLDGTGHFIHIAIDNADE